MGTLPVTDTVLELLELLSLVTQTVLSFQLKPPTLLLPEKLLWLLLLLEVMVVLQTHHFAPGVAGLVADGPTLVPADTAEVAAAKADFLATFNMMNMPGADK